MASNCGGHGSAQAKKPAFLVRFRMISGEELGAGRSPEVAAIKMDGHKTQSIYSRYAIADEGMLKDAAIRLARLRVGRGREVVSTHS